MLSSHSCVCFSHFSRALAGRQLSLKWAKIYFRLFSWMRKKQKSQFWLRLFGSFLGMLLGVSVWKTKETVGLLLNGGGGTLVKEDTEDKVTEYFSLHQPSLTRPAPSNLWSRRPGKEEYWEEDFPLSRKNWVKEHLHKFGVHMDGSWWDAYTCAVRADGHRSKAAHSHLWLSREVPEEESKCLFSRQKGPFQT